MRTESLGTSYLVLPDGPAPYPGVVVIHEASGLNDNIRDICRRFAAEGYAALGVTWACTDGRLGAIAPFYGAAPKPREAIRRLCPVVGSWPGKDFTTKAAGVLEADLTAAGIPHDLKVYPGAKHSFFNDQWRNYHAAAAADSWQRVLAFFAEHVRGSPAAAD